MYPPLFAYLLAPFTLLPPIAAQILATALVAAAVPATLLVLGVRDWRCYAIVFLWWPTIIAIQSANITLPLLLGTALVWRYRDRRVVAAVIAGLVIALKPFFWPHHLLVRRHAPLPDCGDRCGIFRSARLPAMGGNRVCGTRRLSTPSVAVSSIEGPRGYSVAALLHAMLRAGRRRPRWRWCSAPRSSSLCSRRAGGADDRDAFALSLVAMLVLSPLFEMHYLVLLLVVVALYRQTFGLAWAVPLLAWGVPANVSGSAAQVVHVLAVVAATCAVAYWDWRPRVPVRALGRRKAADPAPLSY